ncbi:MAG: hypothetical protein IJW10_04655 [Clostridia bacterium]|nr:hypothetical protein [Clostridia bacterium]
MKTYNFKDSPIQLHGAILSKNGRIVRMDEDVAKAVNEYTGVRVFAGAGVRVRFKTNSSTIKIKAVVESNNIDWAIPLSGSCGIDVMIGNGKDQYRLGILTPTNYGITEFENTFVKEPKMDTVSLLLPRNEPVLDIEISIDDDAQIEAPDPYKHEKPIVFYGSSITEGGCASSVSKCYVSIVTRWLDTEYINLGVSGNAKGEPQMADYIKNLDMSVFVMDYDHNAPTPEHLEATHETFFKIIREKKPTLPVVFMTKPDFDSDKADNIKRRNIIRKTYENAIANGDKNVYFIDGEAYFGDTDRSICTVEGCHPTDLGFMRMAQTIYPVLKEILEKE